MYSSILMIALYYIVATTLKTFKLGHLKFLAQLEVCSKKSRVAKFEDDSVIITIFYRAMRRA